MNAKTSRLAMMARLYPERVVYYSTTTLMTISSFHGVDSPLFAYHLEQPEEEKEEEEEERERET